MKVLIMFMLMVTSVHGAGHASPQVSLNNIAAGTPFAIAKGALPGMRPFSRVGENDDIDTGSGFEFIWDGGGTYVPPTTARLHDIVSTNAGDVGTVVSSGTATGGSAKSVIDSTATFSSDGVVVGDILINDTKGSFATITGLVSQTEITIAGALRDPANGLPQGLFEAGDVYRVASDASTGAAFVYIEGLNIFRQEVKEFVILNGTTNVPTVNSYTRHNRLRASATTTAGTLGTITSTAQVDGTVTAQIVNGNNQTLMAIYTVPVGKSAMLISWWGAFSKKNTATAGIRLRAGVLDGVHYTVQVRSISSSATSSFNHPFIVPVMIPAGADIWIEADTDANNSGISAGLDQTGGCH